MDINTVFVRTRKGEDEMRNQNAHLVGDIRRALLMVDGTATFGEISKRAAPSLRSILDEMFKELENGGFIQKFIQEKAKAGSIPKMGAPLKMAAPSKKPANEGVEELDFTAAFRAPSADMLAAEAKKAEAAKLKMADEARVRAEAEAKAQREIEAAKLKAQQEAEEARLKAEREAAKVREEAERRAREEAEAARVKAEQEAARVRAELEAAKAKAEAETKARAEAEAKARQEIEAAKLKAQQEAEEARLNAEREAAKAREEAELAKQKAVAEARAREEAERRAREEAEAVRVKAEQEAARVRAELEAAKAKAEAEAKAREEAERRAREEAEAAKLKVQQEAEARLKAEQEAAKARKEAERQAKKEAEAAVVLKSQQEAEAAKSKTVAYQAARSTSATVLFLDVVGYTKQPVNKQIEIKKQFNQLVTKCLETQGSGECIILDTGDGAAIGFLQHPEEALEVAMQFRMMVMANQHKDYPDLNVRIGIHLGPINVAKDINGRSNMVGDGINDAQRVMSFAGIDQIYISRAYYDFVSRLSDEYANMFQYRGSQKDKHGREHPVYELMDIAAPVAEAALPQAGEPAVAIKLEPFSFAMPEAAIPPATTVAHEKSKPERQDVAALMGSMEQFKLPEEAEKPVEAAQAIQQPSAGAPETPAKPAAEVRMPSAEEVAKLAETQAKAWAEAEQRAAEAAKISAERAAQPTAQIVKDMPRARRKPVPWGKIGAGLFVVLLVALFAVPPLLPTQGYATSIEQLLTARLQQPVHVGHLAGRLLPTPRLELKDVSIGETKPIQVPQARVDFALSALFSSNKPITGVELEGVQVNGAALPQISAWLQKIAADTQYPVARIELSQGKLEADS